MFPLGFLLFILLEQVVQRNREILKLVRELESNKLNRPWIIYTMKTIHFQLFIDNLE